MAKEALEKFSRKFGRTLILIVPFLIFSGCAINQTPNYITLPNESSSRLRISSLVPMSLELPRIVEDWDFDKRVYFSDTDVAYYFINSKENIWFQVRLWTDPDLNQSNKYVLSYLRNTTSVPEDFRDIDWHQVKRTILEAEINEDSRDYVLYTNFGSATVVHLQSVLDNKIIGMSYSDHKKSTTDLKIEELKSVYSSLKLE